MTSQPIVRIAFLDVGQGDSIVVSIPETKEAVVIDCPEADVVFEYLKSQEIQHVRGLIITHLHLDHYKKTTQFLENCSSQIGTTCERLLLNWAYNSTTALAPDSDGHSEPSASARNNSLQRRTSLSELKSWADRNEAACTPLLRSGTALPLQGRLASALEVLQPSHGQTGTLQGMGLNNTAAIIRVHGAGTTALLTSDIEPTGWRELQKRHSNMQSDVLKFPHHGSWKEGGTEADPDDILNSVQPSYVIISVGTDGSKKYNHPNPHVFKALAAHKNIQFFCTQATTQCSISHALARDLILQSWSHHREASQFVRTESGCPCASTIIIDLDTQVNVLQPDPTIHFKQIIQPFLPTHQCLST